MVTYHFGPFSIESVRDWGTVNGVPSRMWRMSYGDTTMAEKTLQNSTISNVWEAFSDERVLFERDAMRNATAEEIELIDYETGDAVASFLSSDMCGMTVGLINDSSRYWLRSSDRKYSRDVTLSEFAQVVAKHQAAPRAWIADLLPDAVMSTDPEEWRPPTSWELRHVVGEGSFTGVTGAQAAALVGVMSQSFRKYTAKEGAATRQNISFAMWHWLLHRLGVVNNSVLY